MLILLPTLVSAFAPSATLAWRCLPARQPLVRLCSDELPDSLPDSFDMGLLKCALRATTTHLLISAC